MLGAHGAPAGLAVPDRCGAAASAPERDREACGGAERAPPSVQGWGLAGGGALGLYLENDPYPAQTQDR